MFRNPRVQYAILGGALLVLLAILGWWVPLGERVPSPKALAETALSDAGEDRREEAAVALASHPDRPVAELRRVFSESESPRVRAAAALGLGRGRDWDSMPQLIEAMESPSALLRGRAAAAVEQITNQDFGFRANDPRQKRREVIDAIKKCWPVSRKIHLAKQRRMRDAREKKP